MRKVFISVLALVLWAYVIQAQAPQTQATRTTTAAPTYTTGTYNPLSTDTSGNLRHIAIQANPDNATGAKYYIGNPGLTTTHYGVMLYASQTFPIYSMEANLIRLDHIYLLCDTAGETMNLTFLTR